MTAADHARKIREALPPGGLFAGLEWKIAPAPFPLGEKLAREMESLGRVLLQFYRAANLLYRKSVEGRQPEWVARWLDLGKPCELVELQRSAVFKNEIPRVIRPDILLTENGFSITELDSVPGGIGLTAWLAQTYSKVGQASRLPGEREAFAESSGASVVAAPDRRDACPTLLGGAEGMLTGFASIFGDAKRVRIIVSEEAKTYRPEMEWLAAQLGPRFTVHDSQFTGFAEGGPVWRISEDNSTKVSAHITDFAEGDAVYRFFELFDVPNVANAKQIFALAAGKKIRLTPPPKPLFEEKMLFALLWNRHLQAFWRQELGEGFLARLKKIVPYTWLVDPAPLPPHAAIPGSTSQV